jgi:hypothetical protein
VKTIFDKKKTFKKIKIHHLMLKILDLTGSLVILEHRSARVSKVIGSKDEKHLIFIYHSKAKILIRKTQLNKAKKKSSRVTRVFFQNEWKIP